MIIRFHIILRIFIDWFINSEKESLSLSHSSTNTKTGKALLSNEFLYLHTFFRTIKHHLFSVNFSSIYHRSNFPRTILASRQLATYSKTSTRDKLRWKKKEKGKNGGFSQFTLGPRSLLTVVTGKVGANETGMKRKTWKPDHRARGHLCNT